ncbi:ATP-binding protein [Patescibacteria group bacterium]|nr:ATP-binding protein [Patescibacteria group bacterium]
MIKRVIQDRIEKDLFKGRVIVIYGPRRSGKTTLIRQLQKKYNDSSYFNCDEPEVKKALENKGSKELKEYVGDKKLVFIDEAQRVENIGLSLKLLVDNYPETQIVATGSSAFELSNKISEPLTGRKWEFFLYPFSLTELLSEFSKSKIESEIERRIIFGNYPEVVLKGNSAERLFEITKSYLYKDIFEHQEIKNPEVLEKLLSALALQIGSEVSYNELANLVGVDKNTVQRYIQLLEKAFVIFRVRSFSRNKRKEIGKLRKIYFYDLGVRNALIRNFNQLNLRNDVGALWENFVISERVKFLSNVSKDVGKYFWRTYRQEEIDWLEEEGGIINGYEIKWKRDKLKVPKQFRKLYPEIAVKLINKDNFIDFVSGK